MLAILATSGRYPFSKRTIASHRSRFRRHSRGKQPARRCPARSDRLRLGGQDTAKTFPYVGREKEVANREALIPCWAYEPLLGIAPASARIQRSPL